MGFVSFQPASSQLLGLPPKLQSNACSTKCCSLLLANSRVDVKEKRYEERRSGGATHGHVMQNSNCYIHVPRYTGTGRYEMHAHVSY